MIRLGEPIFLDANVPLYTIGNDNDFRQSCLQILAAAAQPSIIAVTDAEVIQEIAYQTTGRGRRAAGLYLAERFMALMAHILPVDAGDMAAALSLLKDAEGLTPRDAVHLAVMRHHGITQIITADRHFAEVPGLTVLDPRTAVESLP